MTVTTVDRIEEALHEVSSDIDDRDRLLGALAKIRDMGFKRIELRNTRNNERIRWAQVIISSCKTSDQIMKSREQDELVEDFLELKKEFLEMKQNDIQ